MKKILLIVLSLIIFSSMSCAAQDASEIYIEVLPPKREASPADISQISILQEEYAIYSAEWKMARGQTLVDMKSQKFEDGEQYFLVLDVYVKNAGKFPQNLNVLVNGEEASGYGMENLIIPAPGGHKIITIGFPAIKKYITLFNINVNTPNIETFPQKPEVATGTHGIIKKYKWICNDKEMYAFQSFAKGNSYKLEMVLEPYKTHEFNEERIEVNLNGEKCEKSFNTDGTIYILYDFGKISEDDYNGEHLKFSKDDSKNFNLPKLYFEDGIDWHQIYMDSGHEMEVTYKYDWFLKNLKTGEEIACVSNTKNESVQIKFVDEGEYILYCKGVYFYLYNDISTEFTNQRLTLSKFSKPYRITVSGNKDDKLFEIMQIVNKNVPFSFAKKTKYFGKAFSTFIKGKI